MTRAMADALALPAGELDAALAHMRLIAAPSLGIHQRFDEFMRLGVFCDSWAPDFKGTNQYAVRNWQDFQ
jgi:hypothetical protein